MGNSTSKPPKGDKENAITPSEIGLLDQIFHEMAIRSPNFDTISKHTLLKFFDLPGVLGDRLFQVFDAKNTGEIDLEEFLQGYHKFATKDLNSKMEMLFQLFDLDDKGGITEDELRTVLLSIVTPPNQVMQNNQNNNRKSNVTPLLDRISLSNQNNKSNNNKSPTPSPSGNPLSLASVTSLHHPKSSNKDEIEEPMDIDEVQLEVNKMVEQAFKECDVDQSGRLELSEFKQFIKKNPTIIETCEELFVQLAWNGPQKDDEKMNESTEKINRNWTQCEEKECRIRFVKRRESIPSEEKNPNEDEDVWNYVIFAHDRDESFGFQFCPNCGKKLIPPNLQSAENNLTISQESIKRNEPNTVMKGNLKVEGGKFKMAKLRWVELNGKFLYVFKKKGDPFPDTVLFVQGYFILLRNNYHRNSHLIRLVPPLGSTARMVNFFSDNEIETKKWVDSLEISAQTISIDKFYDMITKLGKGSFAEVYKAKKKTSGLEVAVKIIEKKKVDKQKEYIRIELSVMKLVTHPNVMRLEQVFETKTKIYMVMPLYTGGDLYEYMKKKARKGLQEDQVRQIIYQVIHALKYLHNVGIVHRDLKPENLLLKKDGDPTDVVITDFGLSKFAAPHEAMKAACGTLAYVAPEVLRMKGYGKEVDLWSTGIIMYLLIRAKLPFYDDSKNKIIKRILNQKPKMSDSTWQKISREGKDLIKQLLIKNPKNRITCDEGLQHPFFAPIRLEIERRKRQIITSNSLMNIPILEKDVEDNKKCIQDIKYGNVDAQTLQQKQLQESINDKLSPMQLIKQTSIGSENQYAINDFDDDLDDDLDDKDCVE